VTKVENFRIRPSDSGIFRRVLQTTICDKSIVEIQHLLGEAATCVCEVKDYFFTQLPPLPHPACTKAVQPDLEAGWLSIRSLQRLFPGNYHPFVAAQVSLAQPRLLPCRSCTLPCVC
jgi:hypothetical protein